jgi:hypothetical protein
MRLSLSLLLILICGQIQAQDSENSEIEKTIESSNLIAENDIDYTEFQANNKNSKKTNINKIGSIDLHTSNILTFGQIEKIIEHQKLYGPIKSKYELQTIEELDSNSINAILCAFDFNDFSLQNLIHQKRQELLRLKYSYRLEKSLGFKLNDSNKFIGNRSKVGLLYHSESSNLDYGLHIEKDAGESAKMLFQSAYVFIKPKNKIQNILLGDQQINFAQGLCIGTGIASGKSALVMQVMKNNIGCKPYKSFNETGFLRGASIKIKFSSKIETVLLSGVRQMDSKLQNDSNEASFGSILNTGYYRNLEEQKSRHQLYQFLSGTNLIHKTRNFEIGASIIYHEFKKNPFKRQNNENLKIEFENLSKIKIGFDWKFHLKNNLIFGEIAKAFNNGTSMVVGLLRTLGKKTDLSMLYRYYNFNNDSKLSNGFGTSSSNSNEKGFYCGLSTQLPAKITFCFYSDLCQFDKPKFRIDAKSYQSEQMLELAYKTKQAFSIYLRLKHTEQQQNDESISILHSLEKHQKTVFRIHSEIKFEKIKLRNRLEYIKYQIENGSTNIGNLIYQDIQFNVNTKTNVTFRYSVFSSDDYNSRTFAYENDVPGSFNIPAYIGKGNRGYLLIKHQIQKDLQIWFRFARSSFAGAESNGTGLNYIDKPHASDLTFQLQWKL